MITICKGIDLILTVRSEDKLNDIVMFQMRHWKQLCFNWDIGNSYTTFRQSSKALGNLPQVFAVLQGNHLNRHD